MKKIAMLSLAVMLSFGAFVSVASADTVCGNPADSTSNTTYTVCSNGPVVPQKAGGRYLKAGDEDCPAWFPSNFGRACYTMRVVGSFFYPLN